jgi:hypothetical protein
MAEHPGPAGAAALLEALAARSPNAGRPAKNLVH